MLHDRFGYQHRIREHRRYVVLAIGMKVGGADGDSNTAMLDCRGGQMTNSGDFLSNQSFQMTDLMEQPVDDARLAA
jgi:hypothetical protein